MKILITNDDGIKSPVIPHLVKWASNFAEVTTVAPKHQQSGKSHGIELHRKIEIKKVDIGTGTPAYYVDSTPADCVRFAVFGLKEQYDLVISGINHGYNLGQDIVYSGTCGAIFEAARQNINGLALSTTSKEFDSALASLDFVWKFFEEKKLWELTNLYNVNIPPEHKGVRFTRQGGIFYNDFFEDMGDDLYRQGCTAREYDTTDPYLDINAINDSYMSITPLILTRTDEEVYKKLQTL